MKILSTIIFYFLNIYSIFADSNSLCQGKRYHCSINNDPNICVNVSDYKGKVFELQKCPDGYYCPHQNAAYQKPVKCLKQNSTQLVLPGEMCQENQDCLSNICKDSTCVGKGESQSCTHHQDCHAGYFCNSTSLCQKQKYFNDDCKNDFDCQNNCVCNLLKCAYYYSLQNNISADNPKACLTGYINTINNTCQQGPHSQLKGRPCESSGDCVILDINNAETGYSQCQCGFNAGSFSYCSLVEGDSEYQQIIDAFQWILQTNSVCHTLLRYGPCRWLYPEEVSDYWKAVYYYEKLPQITFNDECIKQIYTSEYWNLQTLNLQSVLKLFILIYFYFN